MFRGRVEASGIHRWKIDKCIYRTVFDNQTDRFVIWAEEVGTIVLNLAMGTAGDDR